MPSEVSMARHAFHQRGQLDCYQSRAAADLQCRHGPGRLHRLFIMASAFAAASFSRMGFSSQVSAALSNLSFVTLPPCINADLVFLGT